jgi:hypothetical protein
MMGSGPLGVVRGGNVELLTLTLSFPSPVTLLMMGSGPLGVVRGGNVELLTLTLSFPSNRKRYELGVVGF